MNNLTAIDAARSFLNTVWEGEPPDDAVIAATLDSLLASYHCTSETHPSDSYAESPREDWRIVSEEVAARFPAYGYYPVADPTAAPGEAAMTGDAIDDLLDIIMTMREVVWRAENRGIDDAAWYFRLDYFHWGRHARELALYLHARQFS
jgi:hypothetical protein